MSVCTADRASPHEWVMGHGWEEEHWDGSLPSADWIDDISAVKPCAAVPHGCSHGAAQLGGHEAGWY